MGRGGIESVEAGFYGTDSYPDGTPVTNVAAWNEFGTTRGDVEIPARPFMGRAAHAMRGEIVDITRKSVNPRKMVVDETIAQEIGAAMVRHIQTAIDETITPPNAKITISKKQGNRPIQDSGKMRRSVRHKITR